MNDYPFPWAYLLSFVSGGRSRSGNKNAPPHAARKPPFPRAQNRAFLLLFCGKKRLKKTLCRSSQRKRRTQLLLLSDPPRRAFGLDYDPGPLFCVHLPFFQNPITVFIIAPQKNRVNPKPCIYSNFICRLQSLYMFRTAETKRPLQRCGASERAFCLDIALV